MGSEVIVQGLPCCKWGIYGLEEVQILCSWYCLLFGEMRVGVGQEGYPQASQVQNIDNTFQPSLMPDSGLVQGWAANGGGSEKAVSWT